MRIRRLCLVALGAAAVAAPAGAEEVVLQLGSPMKYQANYSNPGVDLVWMEDGFEDGLWTNSRDAVPGGRRAHSP